MIFVLGKPVLAARRASQLSRYTAMTERQLPSVVLEKATLRGNEYAWPFNAVEDAIESAARAGYAVIGGQPQFRLPDATYEMYWIDIDASEREEGEAWEQYVVRSAKEVIEAFRSVVASTDFKNEAQRWPALEEKMSRGEPVLDQLCAVLYFESEEAV